METAVATEYDQIVEELRENQSMKRLAGFHNRTLLDDIARVKRPP